MKPKSKEVVRKVIDKKLVTSFPTVSPLPQVAEVFEPGVHEALGNNQARIVQLSEILRRQWVNAFLPGFMCKDPNTWHAVQYVSQHSFKFAFPAFLRWAMQANRAWVEPFFEAHLDLGNIRQQWKLDYYLDFDEEQGQAVARVLLFAKTFHRSKAAAKALESHWNRYLKKEPQPWWHAPAPAPLHAQDDALEVEAREIKPATRKRTGRKRVTRAPLPPPPTDRI